MGTILPDATRHERRERSRHTRHKWIAISVAAVIVTATAAGIGLVLTDSNDSGAGAAANIRSTSSSSSTSSSTSTLPPTTTTTTLPPLAQPAAALSLPPFSGSLGPGSNPDIVRAYQQRLADLRFDPGPVDGIYDQAMTYAVEALEKLSGLERRGRIGIAEALTLAAFQFPQPLQPTGEANRTEIDVTKQVITLYENYQVRLITTTSTGSGERYCFNTPRVNPTQRICEVATTPSGRFTYTRLVKGWDKSPLGQLYQPYYFNGGIAVHGYSSVPTSPASHGCTRIPMHIAEYFPILVKVGDPVYVFGGAPAEILSSVPIAARAPATPPPVPPATTPPTAPPVTPPST